MRVSTFMLVQSLHLLTALSFTTGNKIGANVIAEGRDEASILQLLDTDPGTLMIQQGDLKTSIDKGWWQVASRLVDISSQHELDLTDELELAKRAITTQLKRLEKKLKGTRPIQTIVPAAQWAQSLDSVYLEIKFAHKLDAPAALSVKQEELSVSEDRVALVASQGHKKYSFNLQFHDSIDPERSAFSMSSVGRCNFIFKKKTNRPWPVIGTPTNGRPANIHVWWEMKERFEAELTGEASTVAKKETEFQSESQTESNQKNGPLPTTNSAEQSLDSTAVEDVANARLEQIDKEEKARLKDLEAERQRHYETLEKSAREQKEEARLESEGKMDGDGDSPGDNPLLTESKHTEL